MRPTVREALYYDRLPDGNVRCRLCPFDCVIADGAAGHCRVRRNKSGTLYSAVAGMYSGVSMDPIEKKPLYHFFPGSRILSAGTMGCNFRCKFCQNADISQTGDLDLTAIEPRQLLEQARTQSAIGIAFTYTEPSIWIETVLEAAPAFRKAGLKNVLVTNGYFNRKPLDDILPYVDAMNIDVKAFTEDFYSRICGARLKPVLENVEYLHDKVHLELTMLVVPTLNDDMKEIREFVGWVAGMDRSIPVHFSRYFPRYRMDLPQTPEKTLRAVYDAAKEKLDHVYVGNILIPGAEDTACASCGAMLIRRTGYRTVSEGLANGKCLRCGKALKGVFL
jgi:pyruvate formate lyase activating enzyme